MPGKTIEERIADADQRIQQLQARKKVLAQQLGQKERKERTRRLIQIGAILSNMGVDSVAKAQALQRQFEQLPEVREWFVKVCEPGESHAQSEDNAKRPPDSAVGGSLRTPSPTMPSGRVDG